MTLGKCWPVSCIGIAQAVRLTTGRPSFEAYPYERVSADLRVVPAEPCDNIHRVIAVGLAPISPPAIGAVIRKANHAAIPKQTNKEHKEQF